MADWQSIVKSVAPMIGTALGGPLGGMAVQAIGSALGLSQATTDSVKQAVMGMTPEQSIAMQQADIQFKEYMAKLGYDNVQALEKIAADDRASARSMQVATRSIVPGLLAMVVTIGFFGILLAMMYGSTNTAANQPLLVMLGSLGTAWVTIVAYYFGSSSGSDRKTELLGKMKAGA